MNVKQNKWNNKQNVSKIIKYILHNKDVFFI